MRSDNILQIAPMDTTPGLPAKRTKVTQKKKKVWTKRLPLAQAGQGRWPDAYLKTSLYSSSRQNAQITTGSSYSATGFSFRLEQCINYDTYAALFEEYRYIGAYLVIKLMTNPDDADPTSAVTQYFPNLWVAVDYNSTDASSVTLQTIRARQGVKKYMLRPDQDVSVYIPAPRPSGMVYESTMSTGYINPGRPWVNCDNPGVPHYGCKLLFDLLDITASATYNFLVDVKHVVEFRGKRA